MKSPALKGLFSFFFFFFEGGLVLVLSLCLLLRKPSFLPSSQTASFRSSPPESAVLGEGVVGEETNAPLLEAYLGRYHSPLAPYAQNLLEAAEKYNLDWRLLPAIAGQESSFCKNIPENSHNCWGWGVHSRGTVKFEDFEEGIELVAKGLSEQYRQKRGINLENLEEIMRFYNPISYQRDGSWAQGVEYFMWELEHFTL